MVARLADLAGVLGVVAVISGRPAAYLAEHLAGAGRTRLYGLYGLEQATADGVLTAPGAEIWRQPVDEAVRRAEAEAAPGVTIEHKGLTVTLHYRAVPDAGPSIEAAAKAIAAEVGLVTHPGKMSVELRPPLSIDKGTVVTQLSVELTNVAFAGDDVGDLPAFAALRDMRAAGRTTLAVVANGPETPQPVLAAADIAVDGPGGIVDLLESVITRLR